MSAALAEPAPAEAPTSDYDRDTFSWALAQAKLIRQGRWAEVDVENVAEEIECLGKSEHNSLESYLSLVLVHLLKWDHQPEKRSSSWVTSIKVHRLNAARQLRRNPGLKGSLEATFRDAYDDALALAGTETGLLLDQFPRACPYTYEEAMTRPVAWPPD